MKAKTPAVSAPAPTQDAEIITPTEVAALLRVNLTYVYEKSRKRQKNPIPVHRIGKVLRYRRSEVLAWFDQQIAGVPARKAVARG